LVDAVKAVATTAAHAAPQRAITTSINALQNLNPQEFRRSRTKTFPSKCWALIGKNALAFGISIPVE
jgi:hypothetical protein